jgi:hypothetical protein
MEWHSIKSEELGMKKEEQSHLSLIIGSLLNDSGSSVSIEIKQKHSVSNLVGGHYNIMNHKITLYIEGIKEQCMVLYGSLDPLEKHLAAVFAHELGHAEDMDIIALADKMDDIEDPVKKNRIALRIETNAWEYAKRLLPDLDEEFLLFVMHVSLEPYHGGGITA